METSNPSLFTFSPLSYSSHHDGPSSPDSFALNSPLASSPETAASLPSLGECSESLSDTDSTGTFKDHLLGSQAKVCSRCETRSRRENFFRAGFVNAKYREFKTCNSCSSKGKRYRDLQREQNNVTRESITEGLAPARKRARKQAKDNRVRKGENEAMPPVKHKCAYCNNAGSLFPRALVAADDTTGTDDSPTLGCLDSVAICRACWQLQSDDYTFSEFVHLRQEQQSAPNHLDRDSRAYDFAFHNFTL